MRALAAVALLAISSCATTPSPSGMAPYCTAQSSFGFAFGVDPEFDGETYRYATLSDPVFEPFQSAQIARSRLSGTIHTVAASRTYYVEGRLEADAAGSARAFADMRARIAASNAFVAERESETSVTYASVNAAPNALVRVQLLRFPEKVTLVCTHVASYHRMWEELPADMRLRFEEAIRRSRERAAEENPPDP